MIKTYLKKIRRSIFPGLILLFLLKLVFSCTPKKTELTWDQSLYQIGSQSSPKAADLNGDGVLDIVMGGG